jgi:hypothetical protein
MDADTERSTLRRFAELLHKHGVKFAVIGGRAELLMGGARPTVDVRLCYRRTRANSE